MSLKGKKVIIFCEGSRGDTQPNIAAANALAAAGCRVTIFCNADFEGLVKSFGHSYVSNSCHWRTFMNENPATVKAISDNDFMSFVKEVGLWNQQCWKKKFPIMQEHLKNNKYDFAIISTNCWYDGLWLPLTHQLPCVFLSFSFFVIQSERPPLGLPNLPCGLNKMLWNAVFNGYVGDLKKSEDDDVVKAFNLDPDLLPTVQDYVTLFNTDSDIVQMIGLDPDLDIIPSKMPANYRVIGNLIIDAEAQSKVQSTDPKHSFGLADKANLERFMLACRNEGPVYLGWGSVSCGTAKDLTLLALRTLKRLGKKGIILKGEAHLSLEEVAGEADEQELRQFAKDNVIFLNTAAHEVLFPQCACIVHHGGTGTTASSVRSGRPVVVTPIFYDQHINADKIVTAGIGAKTEQLSKMTPETLAKTIEGVLSDATTVKRAQELGDKVRSKPRAGEALVSICEKFAARVDSGEEAKAIKETMRQRKESKKAQGGLLKKLCICCG